MALKQPVNQVRLTNVAVVRLRKAGCKFEVACYKNKVLNWREGKETDLGEVLQTAAVFENVSRGCFAKTADLQKAFGCTEPRAICKVILEKGELQVSERERRLALASTFDDIVTYVIDQTFSLLTSLPLTRSTVSSALRDLGFSVRLNSSTKAQALLATQQLQKHLPRLVGRRMMRLRMTCPIQHAGIVHRYVTMSCAGSIEEQHPDLNEQQLLLLSVMPQPGDKHEEQHLLQAEPNLGSRTNEVVRSQKQRSKGNKDKVKCRGNRNERFRRSDDWMSSFLVDTEKTAREKPSVLTSITASTATLEEKTASYAIARPSGAISDVIAYNLDEPQERERTRAVQDEQEVATVVEAASTAGNGVPLPEDYSITFLSPPSCYRDLDMYAHGLRGALLLITTNCTHALTATSLHQQSQNGVSGLHHHVQNHHDPPQGGTQEDRESPTRSDSIGNGKTRQSKTRSKNEKMSAPKSVPGGMSVPVVDAGRSSAEDHCTPFAAAVSNTPGSRGQEDTPAGASTGEKFARGISADDTYTISASVKRLDGGVPPRAAATDVRDEDLMDAAMKWLQRDFSTRTCSTSVCPEASAAKCSVSRRPSNVAVTVGGFPSVVHQYACTSSSSSNGRGDNSCSTDDTVDSGSSTRRGNNATTSANSLNGGNRVRCSACNEDFQDVKDYRQHCRSSRHATNLKRKVLGQGPFNENEWEEMQFDLNELVCDKKELGGF